MLNGLLEESDPIYLEIKEKCSEKERWFVPIIVSNGVNVHTL